jgi:hypothetical protein
MSTTIEPVGSLTGRFLDQEDAAGAGRQCRFLNRTPLDRGGAGRHADNDHGIGEGAAIVHLADEVLDHFFRDFEVGDDAVAHRADRFDIAGGSPQHHLGVVADSADRFLAAARQDGGHHAGFVEDNAAALDIDQRIRCPQIDGHVAGERAKKTAEHELYP